MSGPYGVPPHQQQQYGDHQQQYGEQQGFAQPSQPYGTPLMYQQQPQQQQNPYGQQNLYAQAQQGGGYYQQPAPPHMQQQAPFNAFPAGGDAFMSGLATDMLQQSGANYFQRGQAFMQSRMGFLSTEVMHYFFNINAEYVRAKLLMLVAPFLRRWTYTRVLEQIAGGHKYLPPRQDVNAPDLYIPLMGSGTYCLLICLAAAAKRKFKPDLMTSAVSTASAAWVAHTLLIKVLLYLMGIPSAVPFLEVVAYAGYPFVHVCLAYFFGAAFGRVTWHVMWVYSSLCMAVFIVRTIKRVIFHEARQSRVDSSSHNYVLLGLALFQFPFTYYLGLRPVSQPAPVVVLP